MEVLTERTPAWKKWLYTTDHKRVGLLYLWTAFVFFLLAGVAALIVRWELATTGRTIIDPSTYYIMFSAHGTLMVFLWIIPVFAGFGNYLIPLLIGAPDVAYPRLNGLSYWLYLASGIVIFLGFLWGWTVSDPVQSAAVGWTGYPPVSGIRASPGHGVDFYALGIQLVGASSMMGAINFLVTIIRMRAPGVTFHNMSLFVWAQFTTSLLITFATPSIGNAMLMNVFDRNLGTVFFGKYDLGTGEFLGGNPLLYQHLFWFYSHPAVYVMILPAMGIISEVLPKMVKRPIFGYRAMAYSILAIALLGFTVWMHHMFATGTDTRVRMFFMIMTMIIGVPTGVKIFNWVFTMWGGVMRFEAPLLFCIGFVSNFLIGGIDGVFLASIPVDYQLHQTYWVVAHIHYVLFGGAVMGVFAGIYYWLPLMSGRMYDRRLARWHFWLTLIGLNVVFMTMHFLGTAGMPRRVYDYLPVYEGMNVLATVGAFLLAAAQLPFLYNVLWTLRRGERMVHDPWNDRPAYEWGGRPPGHDAPVHHAPGPLAASGGGRD